MEPLLPERPSHPLGSNNPWVPDPAAMDAICCTSVLLRGPHMQEQHTGPLAAPKLLLSPHLDIAIQSSS
jgi:hypothetical protein